MISEMSRSTNKGSVNELEGYDVLHAFSLLFVMIQRIFIKYLCTCTNIGFVYALDYNWNPEL